jgi:GYF domain 2/TPR repeat
MSDNWYFAKGQDRVGPFSFDQLRQLVASGSIGPKDTVWNEGGAKWVPVNMVPGLQPSRNTEVDPAPVREFATSALDMGENGGVNRPNDGKIPTPPPESEMRLDRSMTRMALILVLAIFSVLSVRTRWINRMVLILAVIGGVSGTAFAILLSRPADVIVGFSALGALVCAAIGALVGLGVELIRVVPLMARDTRLESSARTRVMTAIGGSISVVIFVLVIRTGVSGRFIEWFMKQVTPVREQVQDHVSRAKTDSMNLQFEAALHEYSLAIEAIEKNAPTTEDAGMKMEWAKVYVMRGDIYATRKKNDIFNTRRNNNDRAIADYDEAIKLDPNYAEAYLHRSEAHAANGDNARADADYQEAIRMKPELSKTQRP